MLLGVSAEEASVMLRRGELTVSVFGLGKMGLPLALVFADKGANVIGVDVSSERVEQVNRGVNPFPWEPLVSELLDNALRKGRFRATTDGVSAVKESDLVIIIVPVVAGSQGIDLSAMNEAMKCVGRGLRKGVIVVTETTLPPGTTESYIPLLEKLSGLRVGKDFGLAHAPERTMSGRVVKDITESYPKVIGAINKETLEPLVGVYSTINSKGVVPVSSIKVAEATKVFEGVYRDVNIALANELALIGEELGFNAIEAIKAANTQPYCHIHKPGTGVGGHCIPVYPWFLIHLAGGTQRVIGVARRVNEEMPRHIALLTIKALNKAGKPARGARVIVLGLSYRGDVKEYMNTPSIPLVRELEEWGTRVEVEDPFYAPEELRKLGLKPFNGSFKGADALVIATDHSHYKEMDLEKIAREMRTRVLVDGRMLFLEDKRTRSFYYAAPGLGVVEPSDDKLAEHEST